jgi:hypothetical protein
MSTVDSIALDTLVVLGSPQVLRSVKSAFLAVSFLTSVTERNLHMLRYSFLSVRWSGQSCLPHLQDHFVILLFLDMDGCL